MISLCLGKLCFCDFILLYVQVGPWFYSCCNYTNNFIWAFIKGQLLYSSPNPLKHCLESANPCSLGGGMASFSHADPSSSDQYVTVSSFGSLRCASLPPFLPPAHPSKRKSRNEFTGRQQWPAWPKQEGNSLGGLRNLSIIFLNAKYYMHPLWVVVANYQVATPSPTVLKGRNA